jgi:hypothetical protein
MTPNVSNDAPEVDEDYGVEKPDYSKMSPAEKALAKQRYEEEKQRAGASKEYADKLAEAEEKAAKEAEEDGDERPEEPNKPPEACEQFEGYGEFFVTQDVNVRHQDRKRGDRVALSWEDYQALRDQKIYFEPVPKAEPQERTEPDNTLPSVP